MVCHAAVSQVTAEAGTCVVLCCVFFLFFFFKDTSRPLSKCFVVVRWQLGLEDVWCFGGMARSLGSAGQLHLPLLLAFWCSL